MMLPECVGGAVPLELSADLSEGAGEEGVYLACDLAFHHNIIFLESLIGLFFIKEVNFLVFCPSQMSSWGQ